MGMPRGSKWKRLAVFTDEVNSDIAPRLSEVLRSERFDVEWWQRTVTRGKGPRPARNPVGNLMRDESPVGEHWLMVRRGDWPMAFVIAKHLGVSL
jgi:hypothetical protein